MPARPRSLTAALKLQGDSNGNTHLTFGAGYMGGNWPSEPNQGNTSAPDYFKGQITDITFSHWAGPQKVGFPLRQGECEVVLKNPAAQP